MLHLTVSSFLSDTQKLCIVKKINCDALKRGYHKRFLIVKLVSVNCTKIITQNFEIWLRNVFLSHFII